MNLKHLFVAVPATLFILGSGAAEPARPSTEWANIACITNKWDEKEPESCERDDDRSWRFVQA